jgi:hypothetical protein
MHLRNEDLIPLTLPSPSKGRGSMVTLQRVAGNQ